MCLQSSAADRPVVAEAARADAHPGQAQQHLPARVGRQGPRVDRQPRHVVQRAHRPADAVQLLRPLPHVVAAARLAVADPTRPEPTGAERSRLPTDLATLSTPARNSVNSSRRLTDPLSRPAVG